MFFNFCSPKIWRKKEYYIVWFIETIIQSLLLDYKIKELKSLSKEKLIADVLELLTYYPRIPQKIKKSNTVNFARAFIEKEYKYIKDFCDKLTNKKKFKDKVKLLLPQKDILLKCIKDSNEFENFIFENLTIINKFLEKESFGQRNV